MITTIIVFNMLLAITPSVSGQDVEVYMKYDDLRPELTKSNDTTYVINFWATWCKPCVKELPEFQKINQEFKNQKFKMILVSLDFESQVESKVKPFINERNIEAEVVVLADSKQHQWIDKVHPEWSGSIPITLIHNKDFAYFKEGTLTYEELNKLITDNIIP
jgi:thiol-disulfide isomerase/thioredoxin